MREEEQMTNENDEKSQREWEEDLLEHIYGLWRQDQKISVTEYAMEKELYERKASVIVASLVKQGYLDPSSKKGMLELTEKGQVKGMDVLTRHQKLTQFMQMVSGMPRREAEEDACRIEHFISPKGLKGIDNFLMFGDVYDRKYEGMDFYAIYGAGEFEMMMGIYELERRNPRVFSSNYDKFERTVLLRVGRKSSYFLLQPRENAVIGYVWYLMYGKWTIAEKEEGGYRLPDNIFSYMTNPTIPVTEAEAVIAVTEFEDTPIVIECCELNIHVW